jgi:hypothetical protein
LTLRIKTIGCGRTWRHTIAQTGQENGTFFEGRIFRTISSPRHPRNEEPVAASHFSRVCAARIIDGRIAQFYLMPAIDVVPTRWDKLGKFGTGAGQSSFRPGTRAHPAAGFLYRAHQRFLNANCRY